MIEITIDHSNSQWHWDPRISTRYNGVYYLYSYDDEEGYWKESDDLLPIIDLEPSPHPYEDVAKAIADYLNVKDYKVKIIEEKYPWR